MRAYALSNRSGVVLGLLNLLGSAGTAVALVRLPQPFFSVDTLSTIYSSVLSPTCHTCMYFPSRSDYGISIFLVV